MNVIEPRPNSSLRQEDDLDDIEKELESYIEHAAQKPPENKTPVKRAGGEQMEKGQREALGSDKKERAQTEPTQSDNDDSELDDYNFTEDQRRALEELDNLKTELGYPDEDPPEYNVKERLKTLNKELYEDPTPMEKQKDSKVGFKQNLVDLVAPPPPDFSDDDDPKSPKSKAGKSTQQKQSQDKADDKSETISGKKSNPNNPKDKVLIEREGKFELVSSDDVHARDLGMPRSTHDKENKQRQTSQRKPAPPQKPRPATANGSTRRNVRTIPAKQRPQSAQPAGSKPAADYNSPYALSPREKQLLEERKKAQERQRKLNDQRHKQEHESKERDNRDAFEFWLRKKREDRRVKIHDEDQRQKDETADRRRIRDFEQNKEFATYDILYYKKSENEEAFKGWLKEKSTQFRKEKLLKQREDQELHDGYYIRSREDCDKAYKQWLRHKTVEVRKARVEERQKSRLRRLTTRRTRRGLTLGKSIRDNQAFRYVDYYGYRF